MLRSVTSGGYAGAHFRCTFSTMFKAQGHREFKHNLRSWLTAHPQITIIVDKI